MYGTLHYYWGTLQWQKTAWSPNGPFTYDEAQDAHHFNAIYPLATGETFDKVVGGRL